MTNIELVLENSSGGVQKADGSSYEVGEQVWLELPDGVSDLRGLQISAFNKDSGLVWSASIPDDLENAGFTRITIDGWTIANLSDL